MKNWRTTLTGVLAAAGQFAPILGIPLEIGQAVSTMGLFFLGWNAKDTKVTGVGL
jgi:hypothetical protein